MKSKSKNRLGPILSIIALALMLIIFLNVFKNIKASKNKYTDVRYTAIKALPRFKDITIIPTLKKALSEKNHLIKLALLNAIIELGDQSVVPLVSKELTDAKNPFRIIAAGILNEVKERQGGDSYLQLLNTDDQKQRIIAIRILGELGYAAAVPKLLEQTNDENEMVKISAIESLGKLKAENALGVIKKALHEGESPRVRSAAVVALGRYRQHKLNEYLISALKDEDSAVREYIMSVLVESEDLTIIPDIVNLLYDFDPNIRYRTCEAVGNLGNKSNIADLLELLNDPIPKVRYYAAKAVMKLYEKSVSKMLIEGMEPKVKLSTVIAMGRFGDSAVVPVLERLSDSDDERVRLFTFASLQKLGQEDRLNFIIEALNSRNSNTRKIAQAALFEVSANYDSPLPVEFIKDPDIIDTFKTIDLLKSIREKTAINRLRDYLDDESLFIRAYVAKAIGETGKELAMETMLEDMGRKDVLFFGRVSSFLASKGYTSMKDIMLEYLPKLKDDDPRVKAHAIRVLGGLRDETILREIEAYASDEDKLVKTAALQTLGSFSQPKHIPIFVQALKDEDEGIRFTAVVALSKYNIKYADKVVPILTKVAVGKKL